MKLMMTDQRRFARILAPYVEQIKFKGDVHRGLTVYATFVLLVSPVSHTAILQAKFDKLVL